MVLRHHGWSSKYGQSTVNAVDVGEAYRVVDLLLATLGFDLVLALDFLAGGAA